MKALKYFSILLMGVVCCMATSCSSDNEDEGSDGSKSAVVDGAATSFAYGFYDTEEEGYLKMEFSNVNLANKVSLAQAKKIDLVTLKIPNEGSRTIPEDTRQALMTYSSFEPATNTILASGTGQVNVTIKKNGSNYSVTIPKTEIIFYKDADEKQAKKASFTFNYNGALSYFVIED
jgi:hypothetical protein